MRKLDFFWQSNKDWYYRKENEACVLQETAPKEAKESYARYLEQKERAKKEGGLD